MAKSATQTGSILPLLRQQAETEAAALPALLMQAEKAAHSVLTGEHPQRKPGAGEKFWQFRHYDSADRPQDIDWRQSAKSDSVFVRQKERQTMQTALFWNSGWAGMDYRSQPALPRKAEAAVTIALGLAILMRHGGEQIGLLDGSLRPGRTEAALQTLGRLLLEPNGGQALPLTVDMPLHAGVILCGDFLSPLQDIERALSPLAGRAGSVFLIQTLDPAELTLPFEGRAVFEESPHNERHHIFHVESVRAAYQARIDAHLAGVRDICRKFGWHWLLHTTDRSVRDTLADLWLMSGEEQFRTGA